MSLRGQGYSSAYFVDVGPGSGNADTYPAPAHFGEVAGAAEGSGRHTVGAMVDVLVLTPRDVPLGGPRSMGVRRTLPARERSVVGAWCFVDHYGPDDVAATGGLDIAPHPHCGLATVSWLFEGEVEHRDSLGTYAVVRPGEVNLMTAGAGIAHSEVSTGATSVLHGLQLWVVEPEATRHDAPRFEHYAPPVVSPGEGVRASVFLGEMFGSASPVTTSTPLLGAEVCLEPGASVELDVPPGFEVAVLVDRGSVTYAGCFLSVGQLGVVDADASGERDGGGERDASGEAEAEREASEEPEVSGERDRSGEPEASGERDGGGERDESGEAEASGRHTGLPLTAGDEGARVVVLGGPPFEEEVVMWWNFIGRTHEEIVAAHQAWNWHQPRFGYVHGYTPREHDGSWWIPAPEMPKVRLKTRGNRRRR